LNFGQLGQRGYYGQGEPHSPAVTLQLIERISSVCGSTAFCVWCHTNAIHFIRFGDNVSLKQLLLPSLEDDRLLGGTGLSNAMEYYAGLEPLRLKAERVAEGYALNGVLPYVSN
jgi:alkylation response protein AidB-like acyl-CoA dehydrogenase